MFFFFFFFFFTASYTISLVYLEFSRLPLGAWYHTEEFFPISHPISFVHFSFFFICDYLCGLWSKQEYKNSYETLFFSFFLSFKFSKTFYFFFFFSFFLFPFFQEPLFSPFLYFSLFFFFSSLYIDEGPGTIGAVLLAELCREG